MNTTAVVVFMVVAIVGVGLDLVGRCTKQRCPTIGGVARAVHSRRFGGWLLFAIWAAVGWHLLVPS